MPAPVGGGYYGGSSGGIGGAPSLGISRPTPSLSSFDIGNAITPAPMGRYAEVGKFPLNVVRPGDLMAPQAPPGQEPPGMWKGIGGQLGSMLPGNQRGVGEFLGSILDIPGSVLSKTPSPMGVAAAIPVWLTAPDSQEKRDAQKRMTDPISFLAGMTQFAHDHVSKDFQYSLLDGFAPATSMGDQLNQIMGLFGLPSRLVERTIGSNHIENILATPNSRLPQELVDLKDKLQAGVITPDQFRDSVVTQGFAWSNDRFHSLLLSAATDPLNLLFGAGIVGKVSDVSKADEALRFLTEVKKLPTGEGDLNAIRKAALQDYITRNPQWGADYTGAGEAFNKLPNANSLLHDAAATHQLNTTELSTAAEGVRAFQKGAELLRPVADPIYRFAQKINNLNDPIRWFTRGPHKVMVNAIVNRATTEGVIRAYGVRNVHDVIANASGIDASLTDTINQGLGTLSYNMARRWLSESLGEYAVRVAGMPLGQTPTSIVNEGMKGTVYRLDRVMESYFERKRTRLQVTGMGRAEREAALARSQARAAEQLGAMSADRTAADFTELTSRMTEQQVSVIDGAYFGYSIKSSAGAMRNVTAAEWKAFGHGGDEMYLIGPRELTSRRKADVLAAIKAKNAATVRRQVQTYDQLSRHFLEADMSDTELFARVGEYLKKTPDDQLARELTTDEWGKAPQALKDWGDTQLTTNGGTPETFGYHYGIRPEGAEQWRVKYAADGSISHVDPWIDYVDEASAPFNPSRFDAVKQEYLKGIRGDKIQFRATQRFGDYALTSWGMTEGESHKLWQGMNRVATEKRVTPRGVSASEMWEVVGQRNLLPDRLRGKIGERELMRNWLQAYENDLAVVGVTQKFTGRAKFLGGEAGTDFLGQISEKLYPFVKFTVNPMFQLQERIEPYVLNIMRGIGPVFRTKGATALDRQSLDLVNAIRQNGKYFTGDNAEFSDLMLRSAKAAHEHLGAQSPLSRLLGTFRMDVQEIKKLNYARQWRTLTGNAMHDAFEAMTPGYWNQLEREFGTANRGEIAMRYLTERSAWAHNLSTTLDNAGAVKVFNLGKRTQLSWPHLIGALSAQRDDLDILDVATVRAMVRDGTLTRDDFMHAFSTIRADPEYVDRAWTIASGLTPDEYWTQFKPVFPAGLTKGQQTTMTGHIRKLTQRWAQGQGITEEEFIARGMARPTRITDVGDLPDHALLQTLDESIRMRGREPIHNDSGRAHNIRDNAYSYLPMPKDSPEGIVKLRARTKAAQEAAATTSELHPARPLMPTHMWGDLQTAVTHQTGAVTNDEFFARAEDVALMLGDDWELSLAGLGRIGEWGHHYHEITPMMADYVDQMPESMVRKVLAMPAENAVTEAERDLLAGRLLASFAVTQTRTTPSDGFRNILALMDDLAGGARKKNYGLATKNIQRVLAEGIALEDKGVGPKLYDFLDSLLQHNFRSGLGRTTVLATEQGPVAADVWVLRSLGFVDEETLSYLARGHNLTIEEAAQQAGVLSRQGFYVNGKFDAGSYDAVLKYTGLQPTITSKPTPAQYEYAVKRYNELADAANRRGWMQRYDWTAADMQSVGWMRTKIGLGRDAEPDDPARILGSTGIHVSVPFDNLPENVTQAQERLIADDYAPIVAQAVEDLTGASVSRPMVGVGIAGGRSGQHFGWEVRGSPEQQRDALSAIAYLTHRPEVAGFTTHPTLRAADLGAGERWAVDIPVPRDANPNEFAREAQKLMVNHPEFGDVHVVTQPDGFPAVRFIHSVKEGATGTMTKEAFESGPATKLIDHMQERLPWVYSSGKPVPGYHLEFDDYSNGAMEVHIFREATGTGMGEEEKLIASFPFEPVGDDSLYPAGSFLPYQDQRKGIGDWVYNEVQQRSGLLLRGDSTQLLPAKKMWSRKAKPFGPVDASTSVVRSIRERHDWEADARGTSYLEGLRSRNRGALADDLERAVGPDVRGRLDDIYRRHAPIAYDTHRAIHGTADVPGGPPPLALSAGGRMADAGPIGYQRTQRGRVMGATWTDTDGRVIIGALKRHDVSTGLHELAHAFGHLLDPSSKQQVVDLYNESIGLAVRPTVAQKMDAAAAKIAVKRGEATSPLNMARQNRVTRQATRATEWNDDVSEWFAHQFTGWTASGVTDAAELENSFRYFAKVLAPVARNLPDVNPGMRSFLERAVSRKVDNGAHYNIEEEAHWTAAMQTARTQEDVAFTTQYFKRDRNFMERSINHPYFGMYPYSYMWGKVLPEMIKFLAFQPFGIDAPGWGISQASRAMASVMGQKETDPKFRTFLKDNEAAFYMVNMLLPATPWDIPVNVPAWSRRLAQAGMENIGVYGNAKERQQFNLGKTAVDTLSYAIGPLQSLRTAGEAAGAIGHTLGVLPQAAQDLGGQLQDAFDEIGTKP